MSAQESNAFRIQQFHHDSWRAGFSDREQSDAIDALEAGGLVLFPRLAFDLSEDEKTLLVPDCVKGRSKNVAFDPRTGAVRGATLRSERLAAMHRMLQRYSNQSLALVRSLFPHYVRALRIARTSFRPIEASGRTSSWRKDDRRLHVDAFPSSPNQGERLLRVFSNINPFGRDRVWTVGEPFETVARRYLPSARRLWPGQARLMHALRITRSLRTEYDQIMLQLHDRMKSDGHYQASVASTRLELPPGSTWIVQTDVVSHAALSGQFMLEQTFLLPVTGMLDAGRSPLRILERLAGRPLT